MAHRVLGWRVGWWDGSTWWSEVLSFLWWELICHEEIMARDFLFSNTILPPKKLYWNAFPGRHSGRREKADLLRKRQRCNSLWKMRGSLVWEHAAKGFRQLVVEGRILPAFLICVPLCVPDMCLRHAADGNPFFSPSKSEEPAEVLANSHLTAIQRSEISEVYCKCFFQGNASYDVFQALRHCNGVWLNPRTASTHCIQWLWYYMS